MVCSDFPVPISLRQGNMEPRNASENVTESLMVFFLGGIAPIQVWMQVNASLRLWGHLKPHGLM